MVPPRLGKRVRADELFFSDADPAHTGSYLRLKLTSGKPLKTRGWPCVQLGIRGILGVTEKLEKASFLSDGSLLVKTRNVEQTEKLLKTKTFVDEACTVERDSRLNVSKGTIHAYDLVDLTESEIVGWLRDFGVVEAKRIVRKKNGKSENTPTIILTFDKPTCPSKLQLDYTTYHVTQYIPNPLLCYQCGRFGRPQARCENDKICLQCGQSEHAGSCTRKCVNCKKVGHSCLSRDCEVWQREKDICKIKVEQDLSYMQAKQQYEKTHEPPVLKAYATVTRTPSVANKHEQELKAEVGTLKNQVGMLEKKMGDMMTLLERVLKQTEAPTCTAPSGCPSTSSLTTQQTGEANEDLEMCDAEQMTENAKKKTSRAGCSAQQAGDGAHKGGQAPGQAQGCGRQTTSRDRKARDKSNTRHSVSGEEISSSPVIQRAAKHAVQTAGLPPGPRQSWIS